MPRQPRVAPPNFIYHVITRGNNKQKTFLKNDDYRYYLSLLEKYKTRYKFALYHYALMDNHVHLMIEPNEKGALSEIMKSINLSYVIYFRKRYGGVGHFWQDRFKSLLIFNERYLLKCGCYIELNPVKAGFVKNAGDYRWNSYKFYACGEFNPLLNMDPLYLSMGKDAFSRRKNYINFTEAMMKEGLEKIKTELYVNREPSPSLLL